MVMKVNALLGIAFGHTLLRFALLWVFASY